MAEDDSSKENEDIQSKSYFKKNWKYWVVALVLVALWKSEYVQELIK
jgi:hypothetical protein